MKPWLPYILASIAPGVLLACLVLGYPLPTVWAVGLGVLSYLGFFCLAVTWIAAASKGINHDDY
jgi:endonuclease/exonuclease/phosphatase (EEP) superfamily protein YafD